MSAGHPTTLTVVGMAADSCLSLESAEIVRLERTATAQNSVELLQRGEVMGIAVAEDGTLIIADRLRSPHLWRVDTLGVVSPFALPEEVQELLQEPAIGLHVRRDGGVGFWHMPSATAVELAADGSLRARVAVAAPPGAVSQIAFDPGGGLYVEYLPDSTRRLVRYFALPADTGAYEDIPLPSMDSVLPLIRAEHNGFPVTRPLPFHPAPHWAPLGDGQVVWTDGASFRLRAVGAGGSATLFCYAEFPRAVVSAIERTDHEERITWMNRFTDSNWTWSGPRIPEYHAAIEDVKVDPDGRVWSTTPIASRILPQGTGWLFFRANPDSPIVKTAQRYELHLLTPGRTSPLRMQLPEALDARLWAARGGHFWGISIDYRTYDVELIHFRLVPGR
ncbi:MAG: hypothetical protein U0974_05950 [Gemmatimonadales bacterium]|nr:hypothetical protein [Gemmatimonadales bacterium]MDZ4389253.1 hypothetical protein [Gemmatimonadales bacterium]